MEKEIDKLLRILSKEPDGSRLLKQIIDDDKIARSVIQEAQGMRYVKYFDEGMQKDTDLFFKNNLCKITDKGSRMLKQDRGLEKYIKRNRVSFIISIIVVAIAFCSLIVAILK